MPKKTKVLYLITKASWGGAQRYVFDLATTLPETYRSIVVTGGDGLLKDMLDEAGIRCRTISSLQRNISLFKELRTIIALFSIIRQEQPDILHVNSSKAGLFGAFVGRILRVPRIVFTCHGWAFNEDRTGWQKFIFKVAYWFTILVSHQTIAVSHGLKRDFTWPGVQNKMTVVHLGRDVTSLYNQDDARGIIETKVQNAEANLYDYNQDLWIGSVAELHPTKQLHRLITAMAALVKEHSNVRLILLHDGEERANLEQQVRDLDLAKHVYFTGVVPEAAKLLPAFDIFALPSRSEAFGYVLVEAGLAGVPVVASNVGGIPDIITNHETGLLIPPEDTPALTAALRELITDETLRMELAKANRKNVERFSLAEMITNTTAIYHHSTPQ